ncbi:hypothetical protein PINS_up003929 [Pythium insidiosum]|nr:hypothetical protein PINS_up003929 [Pythium insidiosum]
MKPGKHVPASGCPRSVGQSAHSAQIIPSVLSSLPSMSSITPPAPSASRCGSESSPERHLDDTSDSSGQPMSDNGDGERDCADGGADSSGDGDTGDLVIKTEPTTHLADGSSLPLSCDGYETAMWAHLFDESGIDAIEVDDEPMDEIKAEPGTREHLGITGQPLFPDTIQPTPAYLEHWHNYFDEELRAVPPSLDIGRQSSQLTPLPVPVAHALPPLVQQLATSFHEYVSWYLIAVVFNALPEGLQREQESTRRDRIDEELLGAA